MAKKKIDFALAYQELETLAAWFERGEPDLDAGLEKFERASALIQALQERLQEAEQKIRVIRVSAEAALDDPLADDDSSAE